MRFQKYPDTCGRGLNAIPATVIRNVFNLFLSTLLCKMMD